MVTAVAGRSSVIATIAVLVMALGGGAHVLARASAIAAAPKTPAVQAGGKVFEKWCSDCHRPETGSGSMALQRKYKGEIPAILERRNDLSPELVKLAVRQGVSFMPSFRKTEISDAELGELAVYLGPSRLHKRTGARRP